MTFSTSLRTSLLGLALLTAACEDDATLDNSDASSWVAKPDGGAADGSFYTPVDGAAYGSDDATASSPDGALPDAGPTADGGGPADGGGATGDASAPHVRGPEPTEASASAAGPYKVMSYTSGYADGADFASATVFYPTDATPPLALVAVCPGWVSGEDTTRPWGPFLASHGIAAITIGTNTSSELPDVRARALLQALDSLNGENTRMGSPLVGKLDGSRRAVIGWSMGGGGALLASEQTPSLKAAISLAGWNPAHNYGKVTVPAMLLAVKGDSLAGGQSQTFYGHIPDSTPKLLWEIQGIGLFFAGHDNMNDPLGVTKGSAGRLGLSWMKVFLEGDARYKKFLPVKPEGGSSFTTTDFKTNVTN